MRIDKFLNAVNIVKRRAVAQDMIDSGVVFLNGRLAKASKEVKKGDIITIEYLNRKKSYEVLDIPILKNVPKSESSLYVRELDGDA